MTAEQLAREVLAAARKDAHLWGLLVAGKDPLTLSAGDIILPANVASDALSQSVLEGRQRERRRLGSLLRAIKRVCLTAHITQKVPREVQAAVQDLGKVHDACTERWELEGHSP